MATDSQIPRPLTATFTQQRCTSTANASFLVAHRPGRAVFRNSRRAECTRPPRSLPHQAQTTRAAGGKAGAVHEKRRRIYTQIPETLELCEATSGWEGG